jgi:hypothetical protein
MNKLKFYTNQIVNKADLNNLQDNIENADRNLAMDIGFGGIVTGLVISPNSPNDLTVKYTKGIAYDAYGKRIEASGDGAIDCSSYAVANSGNERWLALVISYARNAYDARADGSETIYYYQDEYFAISIVAGTEATSGSATRPVPTADQVILADIKLTYGLTAITNGYIFTTRRVASSIDDEHTGTNVYDDGGVHGFETAQPGDANDGQMLVWNKTNAKHAYSGNAPTASKLANARTITITGDVNGHGSFDGGNNLSIAVTSKLIQNMALRTWIPSNFLVTENEYYPYGIERLCWSPDLKMFVAVGNKSNIGTMIFYSYDGNTWHLCSSPQVANYSGEGVCWSPELAKFVAVFNYTGDNQTYVYTSTDGINWTLSATLTTCQLSCVCWSPELAKFVAGGYYGEIYTSADGITWTRRVSRGSGISYYVRDIIWVPELALFVEIQASDNTTNRIATSTDGITWTSRFTTNPISAVCWSPELALFVACGNNIIYTSTNGITWTEKGSINNVLLYNIAWSAELSAFVGVGGPVDNIYICRDETGAEWEPVWIGVATPTNYGLPVCICWVPYWGKFVIARRPIIINPGEDFAAGQSYFYSSAVYLNK